jgi:hypothetical protein
MSDAFTAAVLDNTGNVLCSKMTENGQIKFVCRLKRVRLLPQIATIAGGTITLTAEQPQELEAGIIKT